VTDIISADSKRQQGLIPKASIHEEVILIPPLPGGGKEKVGIMHVQQVLRDSDLNSCQCEIWL